MPRKKYRRNWRMPKGLQIYTYKRIFLSVNADLEDPYAEMDEVDWENTIDSFLTFEENQRNLEEEYPQYRWRTPKKRPSEKTWWEIEDTKNDTIIRTIRVTIKPHEVRAKGRIYLHGRIQVTVDKEWIGHEAKISVQIPLSKNHAV